MFCVLRYLRVNKNILILGDGLLGSEIEKQTGWHLISRKKDGLDITKPETFYKILSQKGAVCKYDVVINTIACTDTYNAQRDTHWDVNYKGVSDLVEFCNESNVKLVHIVTDYIYANSDPGIDESGVPVHCANWYGYTKLLGDAHVQLKSNDYLLIRSTHKSRPFKHEYAWANQAGNFDYVDIIVAKIIKLVEKDASGIFNVGTEPKTMFELAQQTKSDVKSEYKLSNSSTPTNVVMSTNKLKDFLL